MFLAPFISLLQVQFFTSFKKMYLRDTLRSPYKDLSYFIIYATIYFPIYCFASAHLIQIYIIIK